MTITRQLHIGFYSKGITFLKVTTIGCIMDVVQVRIPREMIKKIDELVKRGVYPNRSEAIRDAVRRFLGSRTIKSF